MVESRGVCVTNNSVLSTEREDRVMSRNVTKNRARRSPAPESDGVLTEPTWPPYPPVADRAVTDEEIRSLAFHKWVSAGQPHGQDVRFWLEAECELRGSRACQSS